MANPLLVGVLRARVRRAKRKARPKAVKPSKKVELGYRQALLSISRAVSAIIKEALWPVLDSLRNDPNADIRLDAPVPRAVGIALEGARIAIEERVLGKARDVATKAATAGEEANREGQNVYWRKLIGIDPFKGPQDLVPHIQENVQLIRSIASKQLEQVERTVTDSIRQNLRVETIKEALEERFDVSASRAQLIARDQVGKLNAQLVEDRSKSIGANSYSWSGSLDERERPMHRELEGTVHSWDDPPVTNEEGDTNNPGEDYQCRCNALPDVEGVLETLGL